MEEVASSANLSLAYKRVKAEQGRGGRGWDDHRRSQVVDRGEPRGVDRLVGERQLPTQKRARGGNPQARRLASSRVQEGADDPWQALVANAPCQMGINTSWLTRSKNLSRSVPQEAAPVGDVPPHRSHGALLNVDPEGEPAFEESNDDYNIYVRSQCGRAGDGVQSGVLDATHAGPARRTSRESRRSFAFRQRVHLPCEHLPRGNHATQSLHRTVRRVDFQGLIWPRSLQAAGPARVARAACKLLRQRSCLHYDSSSGEAVQGHVLTAAESSPFRGMMSAFAYVAVVMLPVPGTSRLS